MIPNLRNTDELTGFNYLELHSGLPDELLMYADKLSMAHSLELRVPYLDHDIIEYVLKLDASFKINGGRRKVLHKLAAKQLLPKSIIRRKKRGFAVNVVDQWFRESLNSEMNSILNDSESMIYDYFKQAAATRIFREHKSGKSDYHKILFSIICFEYWLRAN